jgi:hypothetical protein
MSAGWSGAAPSTFHDAATDYELGTKFTANADITINSIRVWSTGVSASLANRRGYIRSAADAILSTVVLPDQITTPGWNVFDLVTPLNIATSTTFWVTYGTQDDYGATGTAGMPRTSGDGFVTAILGGFNATVGNLPGTTTTATFYGIDIDYVEQAAGTNPVVTVPSVNTIDLTATISLGIDDDDPGTVAYRIEWGDAEITSTSSLGPHVHTYATAGLYAILVTATDSDGSQDSAAAAVNMTEPDSAVTAVDEGFVNDIFDALVSDVQASGYFDRVNTHEPKRKPGRGLTAAVWCQGIESVGAASGLSVTSARLVFIVRLYSNMLKEPQDYIDPELLRATSSVMRRYHDDYDFSGYGVENVRNIDLLGAHGQGLSATAGYLEMDSGMFRVMDIFVPVIVNDVWQQVE